MKKSFGQSMLRILIVGVAALVLGVLGNAIHPHGISLRKPVYSIAEQGQCTTEGTKPSGNWKVVSVTEANILFSTQPFMVIGDIRLKSQYELSHLPRAIHMPCQAGQGQELFQSAKKESIFLYDQMGDSQELEQAVQSALRLGVSQVYTLQGGFFTWNLQNGAVESGSCEHCGLEEKNKIDKVISMVGYSSSHKEDLKTWAGRVLPIVNASLNGVSLFLLIIGFWAIRQKRANLHQFFMLSAFGTSLLFLIFYLLRFYITGTHRFPHEGFLKIVYFSILFSHMAFAAITPVLVIFSIVLALRKKYERHKKVVRFAWPIWIYVSATGIVVYWMLYQLP